MKQLLFEQLNKINENQACVFSGHRHLGEDFSLKSLKKEIERLIKEKKVNTFYCGMAMGFDLYAGEIVAKLKKKFPVKLIACIPYYGQEKGYLETDKKRYFKLLKACDEQLSCAIAKFEEMDAGLTKRNQLYAEYYENYKKRYVESILLKD